MNRKLFFFCFHIILKNRLIIHSFDHAFGIESKTTSPSHKLLIRTYVTVQNTKAASSILQLSICKVRFSPPKFLPGSRSSSVSASVHLRAATPSLLQFGSDVSAASVHLQQPTASHKRYPPPSIRRKDIAQNTYTSNMLPVVLRGPARRLCGARLA